MSVKRIVAYIIILALLIVVFGISKDAIILEFIIIIVVELVNKMKSRKIIIDSQTDINLKDEPFKKCKYCMSDIDIDAKVCPICRRNQSNSNNPLLLIPIFIIIGIFLYCFFSPNAPESAREIFCSLGLRKGYPYCIKIDLDAIDNYNDTIDDFINNYDFDY